MTVASKENETLPFWMKGVFAPVQEESEAYDLEVIGEIPKELHGRYFRNGANPRASISPDWFLGEGMVHGVEIENGKANWYKNRYVKTPLLDHDELTSDMRRVRGNSLANTHVIGHGDKYFALQELQPPIELTKDLDTVGLYDFGGKLKQNMTAHPKICPKTGEMLFFGYAMTPPFVTYHRVSASGELVQSEAINVKAPTMMHDFVISENYVIVMDFPMLWDFAKLSKPGIPVTFNANHGARFGVMPRKGNSGDIQWFEIEPCYVYHTVNAYEVGGELIVHAPRLIGYEAVNMENPPIPNLHEWRLDLTTGSVSERQLDDTGIDFPQVPPHLVGQKSSFAYVAEFNTNGVPDILGYHKYNLSNGTKTSHILKSGRVGAEASFVSAEGATSEDDGYLLSYIYDPSEQASELVILDAKNISDEPLARIMLPTRVPAGFHGSWISDS